jgi:hypothetical protein
MNSALGADSSQIWMIFLYIAVAVAVLAGIASAYFIWKKHSVLEEDPLPHCNLAERLTQIADDTMLQAKKTAQA